MSKELTEDQKEFLRHCRRVLDNAKKIECPYCHYDGSDSKIGFSMPYVEIGCSVPKIRCKKCKRVFNVIWESKTGEKINEIPTQNKI